MDTKQLLDEAGVKVNIMPFSAHQMITNMYVAFRTCASNKSTAQLIEEANKKTYKEKVQFLKQNFDKKHLAIAEFSDVMFTIEGVPMYIAEQLLRHRHLSFAKKSFRYIKIKENINEIYMLMHGGRTHEIVPIVNKYFYNPFSDLSNSITRSWSCIEALHQYLSEIQDGVTNEDARGALPTSLRTTMAISGNLRCFMEIAPKRLCKRSQGLTQLIFARIKELIVESTSREFESLFEPNCALCEDVCEFPSMR